MIEAIIREASKADLVYIQKLYKQIDEQHHKALPHLFKPSQDIKRPNSLFRNIFSNIKANFLVAEINEKIVALVHLEVRETDHPLLNEYQYGHISDVITDSRWKRKGIGKKLVTEAHEWLINKGVNEVNLTVFSFNKEAISFYQSLGYSNKHITMTKNI